MKRLSESWKPPPWLEPAFIGIAFVVSIIACATLILWTLTTFVVPFHVYSRQTEAIALDNGQTLHVTYPNLVLAGDTPVYINLVLTGASNATKPAAFTVEIPAGLTVVDPVAQSQSNTVQLTAPNLGNTVEPSQMKIGVVNSRSMGGILLFVRQPAEIRSTVMLGSQPLQIGIETIAWTAGRGIVSNTINERSTLILLVTGFLSGAGTLVLQYMKTHRDRVREDWQRKEERFYKFMQEDFEGAINVFLRNGDRSVNLDDFVLYKTVIEQDNWYYRLSGTVREKLKKKEFAEAMRLAKMLRQLCDLISQPKGEEEIELSSLYKLCELVSSSERQDKALSTEDSRSLLTTCKHWEELSSIVIDLIQDFSYYSSGNFFSIEGVFKKDNVGRKILENINLPYVIREWPIEDINRIAKDNPGTKKIADKIRDSIRMGQVKGLSKANFEKLQTAYWLGWRPLWATDEQKPSAKVQRWLSGHWFDDDRFSIGSEYAELDSELENVVIPHPVFWQVNGAFPAIVFGDEGMGKTVSALWLVKRCQALAELDSPEPKIFPVYAPHEVDVEVNEFLVKRISRSLLDFISDNPRRFLNAHYAQKMAMGRLMLHYSKGKDALHLDLFRSSFDPSIGDLDRVLEYISKLPYSPLESLTEEETLNLLYMARPDAFDQVYFIWDIRSAAPHEEVVNKIKDIENLAMSLARQNIFIKIFAPSTAKETLGRLASFRLASDLVWNEFQLRELIDTRVKMFSALWDRGIDDPIDLVVDASEHSPRRVIRILIALLDYVDKHLSEGEKLNKTTFDQAIISLQS